MFDLDNNDGLTEGIADGELSEVFEYETKGTFAISFFASSNKTQKMTCHKSIGNIPFILSAERSSNKLSVGVRCSCEDHAPGDWTVEAVLRYEYTLGDAFFHPPSDEKVATKELYFSKVYTSNHLPVYTLHPTICEHVHERRRCPMCESFAQDSIRFDATLTVTATTGIWTGKKRIVTFGKNQLTDCALVVEGKKLFVCRAFLATFSPYFLTLFFGEFSDKNRDEIELKDVIYVEFCEFLRLLYPVEAKVTKDTVEYLMELANQFQCQAVMDKCAKFLCRDAQMGVVEKLLLADQYLRMDVQKKCLEEIRTMDEMVVLSGQWGIKQTASDRLKAALFYKSIELSKKAEEVDPISGDC